VKNYGRVIFESILASFWRLQTGQAHFVLLVIITHKKVFICWMHCLFKRLSFDSKYPYCVHFRSICMLFINCQTLLMEIREPYDDHKRSNHTCCGCSFHLLYCNEHSNELHGLLNHGDYFRQHSIKSVHCMDSNHYQHCKVDQKAILDLLKRSNQKSWAWR